MLVWEGIVVHRPAASPAASALVISIRREQARQRAVEAFFMAFTHDLKTALASLQLQAESLQRGLAGRGARIRTSARLLNDTVRLRRAARELAVLRAAGRRTCSSSRSASRGFIERTAADWPELQVRVDGDGDGAGRRARARERVAQSAAERRRARRRHDGDGAASSARRTGARSIDRERRRTRRAAADVLRLLGQPFVGPAATSGTGVGLFVSQQLARRMSGDLRFGSRGARRGIHGRARAAGRRG